MCSKKNGDQVDGIENKKHLTSNFNTFTKNRKKDFLCLQGSYFLDELFMWREKLPLNIAWGKVMTHVFIEKWNIF